MHPAVLLSVAGTFSYAFYAIMTRLLAGHDSSATTMVYSGLAGMALMTPVLPFVWIALPIPGDLAAARALSGRSAPSGTGS